METTQPFSFEGKSVAVIGGKGKMGTAFAQGLKSAGAEINIFDKESFDENNTLISECPRDINVALFATNEFTTIKLLHNFHERVFGKNIPIITTSSTNSQLGGIMQDNPNYATFVPIHVLSGPEMGGSVMIDCTESGTLSRQIAEEIAKVFKMEREECVLKEHDVEIVYSQAKFHAGVWNFINDIDDLQLWAKRLPVSQRRASIGSLRVLMRPDISGELIGQSCSGNMWNIARINRENMGFCGLSISDSENRGIAKELEKILVEKDPDGLIRAWVKSENERMDQGVPGGPRSFQEFLRSNK